VPEDVEGDVDRLYGLPPADFVVARDATVRRLRAVKDREGAKAIAALKRPSVAAGIVNRLVRDEPDAIAELRGAADDLEAAVAAGDASAMRAAMGRERTAIDALLSAAREGDEVPGPATQQRVRETLHAAAVDAEAREEVLSGRLVRERQAVGLGPASLFGSMPPPPRERRPAAPAASRAAPAAEPRAEPEPEKPREPSKAELERRRLAERRARVQEARDARDAARDAERAAREATREAEAEAREARRALERAQEADDDAQQRLDAARAAHDAARDALDAAEEAVEQARGS